MQDIEYTANIIKKINNEEINSIINPPITSPKNYYWITTVKQTKKNYITAIKNNYEAIINIDKKYLTPELVDSFLKCNPLCLSLLPDKYRTKKNCLKVLIKEGPAILRHLVFFADSKFKKKIDSAAIEIIKKIKNDERNEKIRD